MNDNESFQQMSEQEQAERKELFRYTDLAHPLMQVLFNLQLNAPSEAE
ncbi:MAG: hypothetical protein JKY76_02035 [Proteobacteria bacterium]|nr:hypothetical protein [Pseudomonadota bacterium]